MRDVIVFLFNEKYDLEEGETILEENISYIKGKTEEEIKEKTNTLNKIIKFVNSIKKNKEINKEE
jgi:hypothetical protein